MVAPPRTRRSPARLRRCNVPQGGVILLEVCLAGQPESCAPCMVALWLRMAARSSRCWVRVGVTPAGLHEGIERVFVAVVPAGRRSPVGCAFGHVQCGCPGFGLRTGSRSAPWWRLPGRGVPRLACVAAMCWGRGWGGACMTRGLRLVGGLWAEPGGMLGVRHRSPEVPYQVGQRPVPRRFRLPPCQAGDWPACWYAGFLAGAPPRYVSPLGVVPGRVGSLLAVALLSAAGVPAFPPWRPPWAPRVVAVRAVRAAWLRRLPVAPPLGFGLPARVSARAGLPRDLPEPVCRQFPPPRRAWLPVSRPPDVGPLSVARGPARLPAGCQPGWWRASGPRPGPGPGWGPGDCQMAFPWAVLPVQPVGRVAVGTPARFLPGLADRTPGPICWVPPELGDWGCRWGCGRGGVRRRGVARAGRLWRPSG